MDCWESTREAESEKRDAPGTCLGQDLGLVQHDDPIHLEGRGRNTGLAHGFERSLAEDRDVKPKVLAGLDGLYEDSLVSLELACAAQHGVRALKGLHGEHGAFANDTALADIENGTFARNVDAVIEVFPFDWKPPTCHATGRCEVGFNEAARVEQSHAKFFNFARDRAEDGFRIAALEGK